MSVTGRGVAGVREGAGSPEVLGAARAGVLGAVVGLAWAGGLRAMMSEIAGVSRVDWWGTFAGILVPGAVVGALLAIAWARGAAGATDRIAWFALAPMAFAGGAMVQPGALEQLFTDSLGLGAFAVPAFAMAGGYAIGASGPRWARVTCGVLGAAFLVAITASVSLVGGTNLAITTPRGAWIAVLTASLTSLLMVATAMPFRYAQSRVSRSPRGAWADAPAPPCRPARTRW